MKWLKRLLKKTAYPKHEHEIIYAFTSGGIDYYQYKDFSNIPPLRGLKTMVFHEEMRMKCSIEYLKLHTEATDALLLGKRINIFEIKKLNDQLKQRLNIAVETELIYKLASVVFFDMKEELQDYDFSYNMKKIQHWKKHNANDFFLFMPLQQLIPSLNDVSGNLNLYSQVVENLNNLHLDNLLQLLPPERIAKLKNNSSFLQMAMLQNSTTLKS